MSIDTGIRDTVAGFGHRDEGGMLVGGVIPGTRSSYLIQSHPKRLSPTGNSGKSVRKGAPNRAPILATGGKILPAQAGSSSDAVGKPLDRRFRHVEVSAWILT
jgi:hypothetical protein